MPKPHPAGPEVTHLGLSHAKTPFSRSETATYGAGVATARVAAL
ncbi:hypothetical protein [Streptomyces buecherae]